MENSDQFIKNIQRCRTLRDNRDNFKKQRSRAIQEVRRFRERVGTRKGEISIAENEMSRIRAAIKENAAGVISFGVNALIRNPRGMREDAVKFAIRFSNALSGQKDKVRRLRIQLAGEENKLRFEREKQADIESQTNDLVRLMRANNCAM